MKMLAHFLAESANFASDGTFTVFKGGITEINSPGWPAVTKIVIITRLELDLEESRKLNELELRITFEGHEMSRSRQPLAVKVPEPGKLSYMNSIGMLNLIIPGPGTITVEAYVNRMALPLLHLTAVQIGS